MYEGREVSVNEGRYGPFVKYDDAYISIPRREDVHSVDMDRAVELIVEKQKADAPIGYYEGKPITKGKGRFGPYVKWDGLFCSITKGSGFQFDTINEEEAQQLVKAKIEKEANRYIQRWDDEGLSIQNGRWGPFIKLEKDRKNYKLLDAEGNNLTPEKAKEVDLEFVKRMVEEQGGTLKKKKAPKKKPAAKKTKASAKKKPAAKKKATTKRKTTKK